MCYEFWGFSNLYRYYQYASRHYLPLVGAVWYKCFRTPVLTGRQDLDVKFNKVSTSAKYEAYDRGDEGDGFQLLHHPRTQ